MSLLLSPITPTDELPASCIEQCPAGATSSPVLSQAVGDRLRDQIALDEGVDYFQVQGEAARRIAEAQQ